MLRAQREALPHRRDNVIFGGDRVGSEPFEMVAQQLLGLACWPGGLCLCYVGLGW